MDDPGERLEGGRDLGAYLVDSTVRRVARPHTPTVHNLLRHLAEVGFAGAPRVIGYDALGREELTYLPGETVGAEFPWPAWVHGDHALLEVARWLRDYHRAVATFEPRPGSVWREGGVWRPGLIVAHGDPGPYNAVWNGDLVGFIDWDNAAPVARADDLAWTAFSWVPLHSPALARKEGFREPTRRRERLKMFLDAYGGHDLNDVLDRLDRLLVERVLAMGQQAAAGDAAYRRLLDDGYAQHLENARSTLRDL
ncbi:phosphotransferase [Nocardioides sp. GXZ039]|uniref:phosphotransferase n=1 Tax=Nocardioides sp. GXZ039 TaxID=3136018 RepID=UPI0030F4010E